MATLGFTHGVSLEPPSEAPAQAPRRLGTRTSQTHRLLPLQGHSACLTHLSLSRELLQKQVGRWMHTCMDGWMDRQADRQTPLRPPKTQPSQWPEPMSHSSATHSTPASYFLECTTPFPTSRALYILYPLPGIFPFCLIS